MNVKPRIKRIAVAVALTAAVTGVLGGVIPVLPAPAASADVISPYFDLRATVVCDDNRSTMQINVHAAPKPGYAGMKMRFSYYVNYGQYGAWSSWTSPFRLNGPFNLINEHTTFIGTGKHVSVYAQVQYLMSNGQWSPAQGTWAHEAQAGYYSVMWKGYCYT